MKKNLRNFKKTMKLSPSTHQTTVTNCDFTAVKWDKDSKILELVAQSLLNFTELFRATNVQIDTMMTVGEKNVVVSDSSFNKNSGIVHE